MLNVWGLAGAAYATEVQKDKLKRRAQLSTDPELDSNIEEGKLEKLTRLRRDIC